MKSLSEKSKKMSRENKMAGQEFLEKNKYNEGVRVLVEVKFNIKL